MPTAYKETAIGSVHAREMRQVWPNSGQVLRVRIKSQIPFRDSRVVRNLPPYFFQSELRAKPDDNGQDGDFFLTLNLRTPDLDLLEHSPFQIPGQ